MGGKIKRYIAKGLRHILQPPALTNCKIDKTSTVCSGSQINRTSMGRYTYIGHDCFFVNVDVASFYSIAMVVEWVERCVRFKEFLPCRCFMLKRML